MNETDESSAQTPPQENEETFYYARMARRDDEGALLIPFSHYTSTSHASGGSTFRPDHEDYGFWLWIIRRERGQEARNYVGNCDLEVARREFDALYAGQGPTPEEQREMLQSLQLLSEWEAEREARRKRSNPFNPMNWMRMFRQDRDSR